MLTGLARNRPNTALRLRSIQFRMFQPFTVRGAPTPSGQSHIPNAPQNSPVSSMGSNSASNVRVLPFTEDIEHHLRRQAQQISAAEAERTKMAAGRKTSAEEMDEEIAKRLDEHEGGPPGIEWKVGADALARELERLRREVEGTEGQVNTL